MFRSVPLDTVAVVVTFDSVMPTLGVIAILPAAPVFAWVVVACVVFAVSVRSFPPSSVPVISAFVVSSTIASATDAPIPVGPSSGAGCGMFTRKRHTPRPCVPM